MDSIKKSLAKLMDYMNPEIRMRGVSSLARELAELPAFKNVPVEIWQSGASDAADSRNYYACGYVVPTSDQEQSVIRSHAESWLHERGRAVCAVCDGRGNAYSPKLSRKMEAYTTARCRTCRGKGTVRIRKGKK